MPSIPSENLFTVARLAIQFTYANDDQWFRARVDTFGVAIFASDYSASGEEVEVTKAISFAELATGNALSLEAAFHAAKVELDAALETMIADRNRVLERI